MRVALFTNNYLPFCGGVTVSVATLREGLEGRGHEVWVFAPRFPHGGPDLPRTVRYPSLPAATYPDFALAVPRSLRIARQVRALGIDVFHAHHPFLLGPTARRLARRCRRPIVFTYHTRYEKYAHYVPLRADLVERAAVRLSTRFAEGVDAVIAPSAVIRDELRRRGVTTPITVVPTGVDVARFRPGDRRAARQALGLPEDGAVALYVGRLDREKNVEAVLTAFDRIAGTVASVQLLLVGDGTQVRPLTRLAAGLASAERIRFVGPRPHGTLPIYYQAADVFLFASETETQGLVLAEAAACGLSAVAVRAPGCEEVIEDGVTGLLTKTDPIALGDAAIALLLDPDLRHVMAERARARAEREFAVQAQIDGTLAVYEQAIEGMARASRS